MKGKKKQTAKEELLLECLDELNDFLQTLDRYPPQMIALSMRVHLGMLLSVMFKCDLIERAEIKTMMQELEKEALEGGSKLYNEH